MARDALLDISGFPVLTREQEGTVSRRLRAGDKAARQEMIQCNLRLVVSVARQYENQGLQILDVIEEGNIGLMRAVERFDPDMECRFSTYAVHWIKQSIRRALLEKVRNIRVPAYMAELVARWKKFSRDKPNTTDVEEIVKALKAGAQLPLGLYRMDSKRPRLYLAWSPTRTPKPNFHVPEAFGTLLLE